MEVEERKWENLASDCLVCIFCYVGLEELTIALPFVCKSWYEASLDPRCWKKLDFQGLYFRFRRKFEREYGHSMLTKISFPSFMKLCVDRSRGSAVELSIPGFATALSLENLVTASIGCPRLKVLSFPSFFHQDGKHLPELISKWKELEILKIAQIPFSILELFEQISMNCPNFRGLHLHGLFSTTETRAIVRCLPRLKILVISGSVIFLLWSRARIEQYEAFKPSSRLHLNRVGLSILLLPLALTGNPKKNKSSSLASFSEKRKIALSLASLLSALLPGRAEPLDSHALILLIPQPRQYTRLFDS